LGPTSPPTRVCRSMCDAQGGGDGCCGSDSGDGDAMMVVDGNGYVSGSGGSIMRPNFHFSHAIRLPHGKQMGRLPILRSVKVWPTCSCSGVRRSEAPSSPVDGPLPLYPPCPQDGPRRPAAVFTAQAPPSLREPPAGQRRGRRPCSGPGPRPAPPGVGFPRPLYCLGRLVVHPIIQSHHPVPPNKQRTGSSTK